MNRWATLLGLLFAGVADGPGPEFFAPCQRAIAAEDQADDGFNRSQQDLAAWERPKRDLISGFSNMYQPCVVQVPDKAYPFRMWFFGWAVGVGNQGHSGVDAIFHARSKDLQKWEVYAGTKDNLHQWDAKRWVPVITAGDKPYDEVHNGDPSVELKDGRYYMAFSSSGSQNKVKFHPDDSLDCVMGATSDDGFHWVKTKHPLIIEPPEMQDPQTDEGWTGMYCRPSLMWDHGKWRLWFDYWHPKKGVGFSLGYAENTGDFDAQDGFQVLRSGDKPLLFNWLNPDVVKVGNRYHCFADAIDRQRAAKFPPSQYPLRQLAMCEAVSDDGLDWKVVGYIPPEDDVPSAHIPQAAVLSVEGKEWLYLFYAAQKGGEPFDYRYDRIRAMRRANTVPTNGKPLDEHGPDSQDPQGVARGKEVAMGLWKSNVFAGAERHCWLYVPAQYDETQPACVMVFLDGLFYFDRTGDFRAPVVFDNLIHQKKMPVTIGVFLQPGVVPSETQGGKGRDNRSFEYDTLSDQYARFLEAEYCSYWLLPHSPRIFLSATSPHCRRR